MSINFTIRPATPDDAAQLLENTRRVSDEPYNGILRSRGDPLRSVDEQRQLIEQRMVSSNGVIFVAEADGHVIGQVSCSGGIMPSTQHTVGLGIMVAKEWRGKGVGTALMERAVEWARNNPMVKRLELDVFTNNPRAAHIYEKVGFQPEGIKRQVYFKDGQFVDAQLMAIIFER